MLLLRQRFHVACRFRAEEEMKYLPKPRISGMTAERWRLLTEQAAATNRWVAPSESRDSWGIQLGYSILEDGVLELIVDRNLQPELQRRVYWLPTASLQREVTWADLQSVYSIPVPKPGHRWHRIL